MDVFSAWLCKDGRFMPLQGLYWLVLSAVLPSLSSWLPLLIYSVGKSRLLRSELLVISMDLPFIPIDQNSHICNIHQEEPKNKDENLVYESPFRNISLNSILPNISTHIMDLNHNSRPTSSPHQPHDYSPSHNYSDSIAVHPVWELHVWTYFLSLGNIVATL